MSPKFNLLAAVVFLFASFPQAASSQERPFYFSLSGGIAEYVGDGSEFIDTGGTVILGLGGEVSPNVALEVEFGGAWAAVDVFGFTGTAATYAVIFGPRFFTSRSVENRLGAHIGGGIGYSSSEAEIAGFSVVDSGFAWEAKVGLDYSLSEAVQLVADVRYGALAEFPDEGVGAVTIGFRFYPAF